MFIVKTIEETKSIIESAFSDYKLEEIKVKVEESMGYITASDVFSKEIVPAFSRSTVDGYAVLHNTVQFASPNSPVPLQLIGKSDMGKECKLEVSEKDTVYGTPGMPSHCPMFTVILSPDVAGCTAVGTENQLRVARW